jgi:hypothetical protein
MPWAVIAVTSICILLQSPSVEGAKLKVSAAMHYLTLIVCLDNCV